MMGATIQAQTNCHTIEGHLGGVSLVRVAWGAKQALHYTDVTPAAVFLVVTKGGNNPLQYVVGAGEHGQPRVNVEALRETVRAWKDTFLSPIYVGWTAGFHDAERDKLIRNRGAMNLADTICGAGVLRRGETEAGITMLLA